MQIGALLPDINNFKQAEYAEFQYLGKAIQDFTGEKKFPIILFTTFPFKVVEEAFIRAQKKGIKSSRYIYGIARNIK